MMSLLVKGHCWTGDGRSDGCYWKLILYGLHQWCWSDAITLRSVTHHYDAVTNKTGADNSPFLTETLPLIDVYEDGLWIAALMKNAGLSEVSEGLGLLFQRQNPLGMNIK